MDGPNGEYKMKHRIQIVFAAIALTVGGLPVLAHAEIVCEHYCQASCVKLREDPMFREAYLGAFGRESLLRTTSPVVSSASTTEAAWEKNRQKCLPVWRSVYDSLPPGIARLVEYSAVVQDAHGNWVNATVANACFRM